jgi:hypothetical protein
MAAYLYIIGNRIVDVIRREPGDVTALPLLAEDDTVSLLNMVIFLNAGPNYHAILAVLGLVNELPEIPPEWE